MAKTKWPPSGILRGAVAWRNGGEEHAMSDELSNRTAILVEEALKCGADAADALAMDERSVSVSVLNGALEHAERSEGTEVGLRVFVGPRQACVSGSDARRAALAGMAGRAVEMARESEPDPNAGLARPEQLAAETGAAELELHDPTPEPPPGELEECALRIEAAALAVNGVSKVESASAGCGTVRAHLQASNGFSAGYGRNSRFAGCAAISGEGLGMETDHYGEQRIFASDMSSFEEIGRKAGERAAERTGARKPRTGAFPVIFDQRVSTSLVGHLLSAINGEAIARGSSWLRDALGEDVLPKGMWLREDPLRRRSQSSRPFDGEGLPTAAKNIVADGVLQTWILDLASGRRLGLESTGNAVRGTSGPPRPGVSNVELTEGAKSRDELASDMGEGLVVTSLIGATINPTTGDYSRGASGFWVEGGRIAYPVNELTIAGNLKEILKSLVPGNDPQPFRSLRVPSLLAEGIMIAGN